MLAIFSKIKKRNKGITLIETIIYVVILTFVMGLIVQMLVSIGSMYKTVKVTRELESSGTILMERMLREIRNASVVVVGESTLGVNPGTLVINGIDEDLNPYKIVFTTIDGVAQISKNDGSFVPLTSSFGQVSYLIFDRVDNSNSEGIKIEMEMSASFGSETKSERFYSFAVLRGSY